jgi:hypothetical protein
VQLPRRPHKPSVCAVLERIAGAADERLLEDEADPDLAAAVRRHGADRHGKKHRRRNQG